MSFPYITTTQDTYRLLYTSCSPGLTEDKHTSLDEGSMVATISPLFPLR